MKTLLLCTLSLLLASPDIFAQSRVKAGGYFGSLKVGGRNEYEINMSKAGTFRAGYRILGGKERPWEPEELKPEWLASRIQAVEEDCVNPTIIIVAEAGTDYEKIVHVVSHCLVHDIPKIVISAPADPNKKKNASLPFPTLRPTPSKPAEGEKKQKVLPK